MAEFLSRLLTEPYLSLLSGFTGALLGAGVSILTVLVQGRHQAARERAKLTMQAAVEEARLTIEYLKNSPQPSHYVPSLSSLIYFYRDFFDLLEKACSHEDLAELYRRHSQFQKIDVRESDDT